MEVGEYDTLVDGRHPHHKSFFQRFKFPIIAALVLLIALAIVFGVVFTARMKSGDDKPWDQEIQVADIMGHLTQLQTIANANNGNRAANTTGYNASVAYVVEQLKEHTNYEVVVQPFIYPAFSVATASNLVVFNGTTIQEIGYGSMANGYVVRTAGVVGAINIVNATVVLATGYGCLQSDYASVGAGNVALVVGSSNCSLTQRVSASAGQALALIVSYNDPVSFSSVANLSALVMYTNYHTGLSLIGNQVSVNVVTQVQYFTTMNVIADTKSGNVNTTIVVGSHLDSVPAGPGINDNGSGSSLNLALALQLASSDNQKKLKNRVRFCWFGAEELGLLGSVFYVQNLADTNITALKEIAVNLNFDMIGSPNFMRGIYNGTSDNHTGSGVVQSLFNRYYASQNLAVVQTAFTGRSDYGPFLVAGIPAGGLFTGAEVIKSEQERQMFGGLAGASYDPCYHQACDTINNINQQAVGDMARGAAYVLEQLAIQQNLTNFLLTPLPFNMTQ